MVDLAERLKALEATVQRELQVLWPLKVGCRQEVPGAAPRPARSAAAGERGRAYCWLVGRSMPLAGRSAGCCQRPPTPAWPPACLQEVDVKGELCSARSSVEKLSKQVALLTREQEVRAQTAVIRGGWLPHQRAAAVAFAVFATVEPAVAAAST